jgi:hypothetical protein
MFYKVKNKKLAPHQYFSIFVSLNRGFKARYEVFQGKGRV